MALIEKLKAIGEAIREKTGKTEKMTLDEMPSEIASIKGGGAPANPVIEALSVTKNGTYEAPSGVDGYSPVTVNVPIPEGYIQPSGTKSITENGEHDVAEFAKVNVAVPTGGGGGGDDSATVAALLSNTLTVLDNSLATSLMSRACQGATKLVTVNLPSVSSAGTYAFYGCSGLTSIKLPSITSIPTQCFYGCSKLQYADIGISSSIAAQAFNSCSALETLIIRKTNGICSLVNTTALANSGIGTGKGFVYVPKALVENYKTATNWSSVATAEQFRAIEDYPEI